MRDARLRALLRAGCLCNDTVVERQNGQILFNGSGTETALVRAVQSLGLDCAEVRARWPRISTVNRTEENRFMGTMHGAGGDPAVDLATNARQNIVPSPARDAGTLVRQ